MTKLSCFFLTKSSLQGQKEILCNREGKKVLQEHAFQSVSTKVLSKPTYQMSVDLVMVVENLEISWCVLDVVIKSNGLDNP